MDLKKQYGKRPKKKITSKDVRTAVHKMIRLSKEAKNTSYSPNFIKAHQISSKSKEAMIVRSSNSPSSILKKNKGQLKIKRISFN